MSFSLEHVVSGFGGGMGRMGETCGAVTGALMVLWLQFGRATPGRRDKSIAEQRRRFMDDYFRLICADWA
jgi:C_GCAxxG_C_C family probable redox protein